MSLSKDRVFKEVITLDPIKQMKASVHFAIRYGTIVGAATAISGILVPGGVVSSCIAGLHGTLKSVPDILCHDTTPEQRKELVELVCDFLTKNGIYKLGDFIWAIKSHKYITEAIITIVIKFLTEMGYKCYTE